MVLDLESVAVATLIIYLLNISRTAKANKAASDQVEADEIKTTWCYQH